MIAVGRVLAAIGEIKLEQEHTPFLIEQNIGTIKACDRRERSCHWMRKISIIRAFSHDRSLVDSRIW